MFEANSTMQHATRKEKNAVATITNTRDLINVYFFHVPAGDRDGCEARKTP